MTKVTRMVKSTEVTSVTPKEVLDKVGGKFFTVTFIKQDKTLRKMVCRKGVHKFTKGGVSTTAHKENLVTVYDTQAKGYRSVNLDTVKSITAGGLTYEFDN